MVPERKEFDERQLTDDELLLKWPRELDALKLRLEDISKVNELVDLIRSVNIRISIAGTGRRKGNDQHSKFIELRDQWLDLKYTALIKTLEWRHEGRPGIRVNRTTSGNSREVRTGTGDRLTFEFAVGRKPYRTETAFRNLANLVPEPRLSRIIGNYDESLRRRKVPRYNLQKF